MLPFPVSLVVLETSAGCWSGVLAVSSRLRLRASGPTFPVWDLSSAGDVTGVNEKQREALPPGVLLLGVWKALECSELGVADAVFSRDSQGGWEAFKLLRLLKVPCFSWSGDSAKKGNLGLSDAVD